MIEEACKTFTKIFIHIFALLILAVLILELI